MRSVQAWFADSRLSWLVWGAIAAHLAGGAFHVMRAVGPVWSSAYGAILPNALGAVWVLGMLMVAPWLTEYLGLGRRSSSFFFASAAALLGLLVTGGLQAALNPALFDQALMPFLYRYPRSIWGSASLALFSLALAAQGQEVRRLRYERDNLQLVLSFSESVSLMSKDGVLRETVSYIRRLTDADACLLFLLDPEQDVLRVAAHYHNERVYTPEYVERMINFPCPRAHGLTGRVMETGEPYLSRNVERDRQAQMPPGDHNRNKTTLLLPMKVQGKLIGVLRVSKAGTDQLSDAHVTVCAILANHAAVALDAGNLYDEVLKASRTDPMTGLGNARAFREASEQLTVRQEAYALLMIDADCLKGINDTLGHLAGDDLLMGLAEQLQVSTEGKGLAYRYAGDEFLILLPRMGRGEALVVAEEVRRGLSGWYMVSHGHTIQTTVSIGVAGYPSDGNSSEAVMRAADHAMYKAKAAGKNQVQLAS